jgi:hypothetical protein
MAKAFTKRRHAGPKSQKTTLPLKSADFHKKQPRNFPTSDAQAI